MSATRKLSHGLRFALDLGPLILFFGVLTATKNIFAATAVFMAGVAVSLSVGFMRERRLSPMPAITAIIVFVFGGLTLYLHNDVFIKIKPTIIYLIFAAILAGGLMTGRTFIKYLFEHAFQLDETGWRSLTWRWTIFFLVMAIANEIVWRNFSAEAWAGYKLFGALPATFLYAIAQTPLVLKHKIEQDEATAD
ncbi:MAG TPA: septation protein A [Rhizomicrobium sp.]|nr:septation protein A [Rhizomicrobium sp.]